MSARDTGREQTDERKPAGRLIMRAGPRASSGGGPGAQRCKQSKSRRDEDQDWSEGEMSPPCVAHPCSAGCQRPVLLTWAGLVGKQRGSTHTHPRGIVRRCDSSKPRRNSTEKRWYTWNEGRRARSTGAEQSIQRTASTGRRPRQHRSIQRWRRKSGDAKGIRAHKCTSQTLPNRAFSSSPRLRPTVGARGASPRGPGASSATCSQWAPAGPSQSPPARPSRTSCPPSTSQQQGLPHPSIEKASQSFVRPTRPRPIHPWRGGGRAMQALPPRITPLPRCRCWLAAALTAGASVPRVRLKGPSWGPRRQRSNTPSCWSSLHLTGGLSSRRC